MSEQKILGLGRKPRLTKAERRAKRRRWIASGVATLVAISWAVGGLVMPSMADTTKQDSGIGTWQYGWDYLGYDQMNDPFSFSWGSAGSPQFAVDYAADKKVMDYFDNPDAAGFVQIGNQIYAKIRGEYKKPGGGFAWGEVWAPVPEALCADELKKRAEGLATTKMATEEEDLNAEDGEENLSSRSAKVPGEDGAEEESTPEESTAPESPASPEETESSTPAEGSAPEPAGDAGGESDSATESGDTLAEVLPATLDNNNEGGVDLGSSEGSSVADDATSSVAGGEDTPVYQSRGANVPGDDDDDATYQTRGSNDPAPTMIDATLAQKCAGKMENAMKYASVHFPSAPSFVVGRLGKQFLWSPETVQETYNPPLIRSIGVTSGNKLVFYKENVTSHYTTVNGMHGWCVEPMGNILAAGDAGTSYAYWGFNYKGNGSQGLLGNTHNQKIVSMLAQMSVWTAEDWETHVGHVPGFFYKYQRGTKAWAAMFQVAVWSYTGWGTFSTYDADMKYVTELKKLAEDMIAKDLATAEEALKGLKLVANHTPGVDNSYDIEMVGWEVFEAAKGQNKDLRVNITAGGNPFTITYVDEFGRVKTSTGRTAVISYDAFKRGPVSLKVLDGCGPNGITASFSGSVYIPGMFISGGSFSQAQVIVEGSSIGMSGMLTIPCTPQPKQPTIGTIATIVNGEKDANDVTGRTLVANGRPAVVNDVITYADLERGKNYVLETTLNLVNQNGGVERVLGVMSSQLNNVQQTTGQAVSDSFVVQPNVIQQVLENKGYKLVFTEALWKAEDVTSTGGAVQPFPGKTPAAIHKDFTDDSQTIKVVGPKSFKLEVLKTVDPEAQGLVDPQDQVLINLACRHQGAAKPYVQESWYIKADGTDPAKVFTGVLVGDYCNVEEYFVPWQGGNSPIINHKVTWSGPMFPAPIVKTPNKTGYASQTTEHFVITAPPAQGDALRLTINNSYKKEEANFTVTKKLVAAEGTVDKDKVFNFTGACTRPDGSVQPYVFSLKDGETFTSEMQVLGTKCTVEEIPAPVQDQQHSLEWKVNGQDPTEFTANGKGVQVTLNQPKQTVAVLAKNVYVPEKTSLMIQKVATLDGQPWTDSSKTFKIDYICTNKDNTRATGTLNLKANALAPTLIEQGDNGVKVNAGAVCKFTEDISGLDQSKVKLQSVEMTANAGARLYDAGNRTLTYHVPNSNNGTVGLVTVTNTFETKKATFKITKKLVDPDSVVQPNDVFFFGVACNDGKDHQTVQLKPGQTLTYPELIKVGAQCTVTENNPDKTGGKLVTSMKVEGDNSAQVNNTARSATFTIKEGAQPQVEVTAENKYIAYKGKVGVKKVVTGDLRDPNKLYTFKFVCNNGADTYTRQAKANETVYSELYKPGTSCVISEEDASVDGYTWTLTWDRLASGSGNRTSVLMTVPNANNGTVPTAVVTAKNDYPKEYGSFKLSKEPVAPVAGIKLPDSYKFTYTCRDKASGEVVKDVNGTRMENLTTTVTPASSVVISGIPTGATGAECSVNEVVNTVPGTTLNYSIAVKHGEGQVSADGKTAKILVKKGSEPSVSVAATNQYIPNEATFQIKKEVSGTAEGKFINRPYTFGWECTKGDYTATGEATIYDPRGGSPSVFNAPGNQIREGSLCHAWEIRDQLDANVTYTFSWKDAAGVSVLSTWSDTVTTPGRAIDRKDVAEFTAGDTPVALTAVNHYDTDLGKLEIQKVATNKEGANYKIPDDYKFDVTCTDGFSVTDFKVPANGSAKLVSDKIEVGATCTVIEKPSQADPNNKETTTLKSGSKTVNGKQIVVSITKKGEVVSVLANNSYERLFGDFKVKKNGTKPADTKHMTIPTSFTFDWKCVDKSTTDASLKGEDLSGKLEGVKWGETRTIQKIPYGYSCEVTELPAEATGAAAKNAWSHVMHNNKFTISAETPTAFVTADNNYNEQNANFRIVKKLGNLDGLTVPQKFYFDYTCTDPVTNKVVANGERVEVGINKDYVSEMIPVGSRCMITELEDSPAISGGIRSTDWSFQAPNLQPVDATKTNTFGPFIIGEKNSTGVITAVNNYERKFVDFKIKKSTTAPDGVSVPSAFDFKYDCALMGNHKTGTVTVPANGEATVQGIPYGSTCTVEEVKFDVPAVVFHNIKLSVNGTNLVTTNGKLSFDAVTDDAQLVVNAENTFPLKPVIGTTLIGPNDSQAPVIDENTPAVDLVDTISYANVAAGNYRFVGVLTDYATGEVIDSTRTISSPLYLEGSGQYQMRFTLPKGVVDAHPAGFTAYEYLAEDGTIDSSGQLLSGEKWVTTHAPGALNWNDEAKVKQTVRIVYKPVIGTKAMPEGKDVQEVPAGKDAVIVDTVDYRHVPAGDYTLLAKLVYADGSGNAVAPQLVEVASNGTDSTWQVRFNVPNSAIKAGVNMVVQEYLFKRGDVNDANAADLTKAIATHDSLEDPAQTVRTPGLKTNASFDANDQSKKVKDLADADDNKLVSVFDKVTWKDLVAGKTYVISGKLHYKNADGTEGGVVTDKSGKEITASKTVVPTAANAKDGSATLEFKVPAYALKGKVMVAFEKLTQDGREVAGHEDIKDKDQTVRSPKIGTTAKGSNGTAFLEAGKSGVVSDVMSYEGLEPGQLYVAYGRLMNKTMLKGHASQTSATESVKVVPFTASATGNGTVTVNFEVTPEEGVTYVAFEKVYLASDVAWDSITNTVTPKAGKEAVGSHEDIDDEGQTVTTGTLETQATNKANDSKMVNPAKGFTITDLVTYSGLIPGKEYTLSGELMLKDGLNGTPTGIKASKKFTPTKAEGTETMDFVVDDAKAGELMALAQAKGLVSPPIVVFEDLKQGEIQVAVHHDINDEEQTVYTPNMKTSATDAADGNQTLVENADATIVDVVTFTGKLQPNTTYTVAGTLMDKATKKAVVGASSEPTVFRTNNDGTVDKEVKVEFFVPASAVKFGSEFVVFEKLWEGNTKGADKDAVLTHEDINDVDQTVTVPQLRTKAAAENGTKNLEPKESVKIVDEVSYSNLIPGKSYTISGELYYTSGAKQGQKVPAELYTVTPAKFTVGQDGYKPTGVAKVIFTVKGTALQGQTLVVFEDLKQGDLTIASHHDINDKEQTVYVPKVETDATNADNGTQVLDSAKGGKISDKVTWTSLAAGTYQSVGTLMVVDKSGKATPAAGVDPQGTNLEITDAMAATGQGSFTLEFAVSADLVKQVSEAGSKFVVYQKISDSKNKVVASEENPKESRQTIVPGKITTNATDAADGDKFINASQQNVKIKDKVTYEGLDPAKNYTLEGELMEKDGSANGKPTGIKSSIKVGPNTEYTIDQSGKGSFELVFTVDDPSLIVGKTVVAFETLSHEGKEFLIHHDINDKDQTITSPKIGTTAKGDQEGNSLWADKDGVITDTVAYENLAPAKRYVAVGTLMDKATGQPITEGVTSEPVSFVSSILGRGTVDVKFNVAANTLKEGQTVVVFEKVYLESDFNLVTKQPKPGKNPVGTHEDINDAKQAVPTGTTPGVKTLFSADMNRLETDPNIPSVPASQTPVNMVDKVSYWGLTPGKSYVLVAGLMYGPEGTTAAAAKEVADRGTAFFTPTAPSGVANVQIQVPAEALVAGYRIVAFETLWEGDHDSLTKKVAEHKDWNDVKQTVTTPYTPSVGTRLTDENNGKVIVGLDKNVTLVDTVSYEGVRTDRDYVAVGKLMVKNAANPDGAETGITAVAKFRPASIDGTQEVKFTIPAGKLTEYAGDDAEFKLVAFEQLWEANDVTVNGSTVTPKSGKNPVATHEEINDEGQTVTFTKNPSIGTTLENTKGNNKHSVLVDPAGATLVDTVAYNNLKPNTTYTLKGRLMGASADNAGPIETNISNTTTFTTPAAAAGATVVSGTAKVEFKLTAADLKKFTKLVAYEQLFEGDTKVTDHEDFNDPGQTVEIVKPKLGTLATSNEGRKTIQLGAKDTEVLVIDKVSYEGLKPNQTYGLQGKLMDHATNAVLTDVTGKEITAAGEFTTNALGKGEWTMKFTVPVNALTDGMKMVVFEDLYLAGDYTYKSGDAKLGIVSGKTPLVSHADINDEGQTITIGKPQFGKFTVTKTVTGFWPDDVTRADYEFEFGYTCSTYDGYTNTWNPSGIFGTAKVKEGQSFGVDGIIDGSKCVITENVEKVMRDLGKADTVKWSLDGQPLVAPSNNSYTFNMGADGNFNLAFTAENVLPDHPVITTDALGQGDQNVVSHGTKFSDTVTYNELKPNKDYILVTSMMTKDGDEWKPVTDSKVYTPVKASATGRGAWTVNGLQVPGTLNANMEITIWQDLYALDAFADLASYKLKDGAQVVAQHHEMASAEEANQMVHFTTDYGSFEVKKIVEKAKDDLKNIPSEFTFSYTCEKPNGAPFTDANKWTGNVTTGKLTVVNGGTSTKVVDLPVGTTCTITEDAIKGLPTGLFYTVKWAVASLGATTPWSTGVAQNSQEFTVAANDQVTVTATNTFDEKKPTLHTVAIDKASDSKTLSKTNPVIVDTVTYDGMVADDREYLLVGELHYANTGEAVTDADGNQVQVRKLVKASTDQVASDWVMELPVPASADKKQDIVVYEYAYEGLGVDDELDQNKLVAKHDDPADANQIVVREKLNPILWTAADINGVKTVTVETGESVEVTDTVRAEGLDADTTYYLEGELMNKTTGKSTGIKAERTAVRTDADGKGEWKVTYTIPAADAYALANSRDPLVVYESLFESEDATEALITHHDINDTAQTVMMRTPNRTTPSTPPVFSTTTTPPTTPPPPPVSPEVTIPALPKKPPILARTGAQAATLGAIAAGILALGAGLGLLARRRKSEES